MNPYEAPTARSAPAPGQQPEIGPWGRRLLIPVAAIAAVPLALMAIPYMFAARAAVFLGHWPYYGHPDPKDLPEHFSPPESLGIVVPVMIFALQMVLIVLLVSSYARPERRVFSAGLSAASLWLLSLVLLFTDPAGVIHWIID